MLGINIDRYNDAIVAVDPIDGTEIDRMSKWELFLEDALDRFRPFLRRNEEIILDRARARKDRPV